MFAMVASGGVQTAWADMVYSFTTIDVPGASPGSTSVYGINNSGQIVGDSSLGAFVDTGGSFTTINVPGTPYGSNSDEQSRTWAREALALPAKE
jgi:hypothetical protein